MNTQNGIRLLTTMQGFKKQSDKHDCGHDFEIFDIYMIASRPQTRLHQPHLTEMLCNINNLSTTAI
jgi:hypothetical protein